MMSQIFERFLFSLLGAFALMLLAHAQDDQSGFISIDCGLPEGSSYIEKTTFVKYISDANFIDSGESKLLLPDQRDRKIQPYWYVRSFPQGIRNCYKINVTSGTKYLIRASFFYGNYDGQDKYPEFELHLGANFWELVKLENATTADRHKELIHVPRRNYIHICLVNTGSGVPFISSIELRVLPNASYETQMGSLALNNRLDTGQSREGVVCRYPDDVLDRYWYGYKNDNLTTLRTLNSVNSGPDNDFQLPSTVMRTAITANGTLYFGWVPPDNNTQYYIYMHFAEVKKQNQSRWLYILRNGESFQGIFSPDYLNTTTIYNSRALSGQFDFVIYGDEEPLQSPILNALEVYTVKEFLQSETNQQDVHAIANIMSTYSIKKNWQGDPCAPQVYLWEGLNCSYHQHEPPRIISLNLSSSRLTGKIARSISDLPTIQTLDLSNNNLTGPIQDFLSELPNLNILNLEKNKFTGSVPAGLIERRNNGLLSISLCENPNLAEQVSCGLKKKKQQHKSVTPVVGLTVGISVLLLIVASICFVLIRKRRHAKATIGSIQRQFTYSEIQKITNNFERILGQGGFGIVYHGCIGETQVAVKILSPSSVQGPQEFRAEVDVLVRVHHINLTILVGYCNDKTNKGLVYEFMANGNLRTYLSVSDSSASVLTWEGRLQIAIDSAQGLEYLHYGCKPPIIHRDVKSSNILLNENFQAKISDFGLSRNFPTEDGSHISTRVAGTPGYLAPEYYLSNRLNEKSDVYSFGVVLLEIITSKRVLSKTHDHISDWVAFMLEKGDINGIFDSRLERNFNVSSGWKAVEIAMACVSADATKRPTMSDVVVGLKECLGTELAREKQSGNETELGSSIEMMSKMNSISMELESPSVR